MTVAPFCAYYSKKMMLLEKGQLPVPCFPCFLFRSVPRDPNGFNDWTFSTVRCWGERAKGIYRLVIRDVGEPPHPSFRALPLMIVFWSLWLSESPQKLSHVEYIGLPVAKKCAPSRN